MTTQVIEIIVGDPDEPVAVDVVALGQPTVIDVVAGGNIGTPIVTVDFDDWPPDNPAPRTLYLRLAP